MLEAVTGTDIANLVTVALYTGLRQGELLGLTWQNVDLDKHQLTVAASLQRLGGNSTLVEPKSEHSRRTLRVSGPALAALQSEQQRQVKAISGPVFTDQRGRALVGPTVTHAFQRRSRGQGWNRSASTIGATSLAA